MGFTYMLTRMFDVSLGTWKRQSATAVSPTADVCICVASTSANAPSPALSAQNAMAPIWSASLKRSVTNVLPAVSVSTSAAGYVQPVVMDSASATLLWPAESSMDPVTGLLYDGTVAAVYTADVAACATPTWATAETASATTTAHTVANVLRTIRFVMDFSF